MPIYRLRCTNYEISVRKVEVKEHSGKMYITRSYAGTAREVGVMLKQTIIISNYLKAHHPPWLQRMFLFRLTNAKRHCRPYRGTKDREGELIYCDIQPFQFPSVSGPINDLYNIIVYIGQWVQSVIKWVAEGGRPLKPDQPLRPR